MEKQQAQSNPDVEEQKTPGADVPTVTPDTDQATETGTTPDAETDPEGYADYLKQKAKKKGEALLAERLAQVPDGEEEPTGSLEV